MRRRDLILGLGAIGAVSTLRPGPAHARAIGGHAFGSSWRLVPGEPIDGAAVRAVVETVIETVDAQMSPYRADSDLSRFNRALAMADHQVPAAVAEVTRIALSGARQTEGAFDPAVGPVVARFGFGPIEGAPARHTDIEAGPGNILRKHTDDATLDLCGIAKGQALDAIIQALTVEAGVGNALVELGGEVAAIGHHRHGRPWQVAVEDPLASGFATRRIVAPHGQRLATSGHRHNGWQGRAGASHIIDPLRGRPVDNGIASVTVLHPSGPHADMYATALCAMPANRVRPFADDCDISTLIIHRDGSETMTAGFAGHVIA